MGVLLQSIAILICLAMLFGVFREMKRQRMSESKALLWILGIMGLLILSCFPGILFWVARMLGISWAPAVLVFFALIVIMVMLFFHTRTVSELESQMMELAMQVALLKEQTEAQQHKLSEMQRERE